MKVAPPIRGRRRTRRALALVLAGALACGESKEPPTAPPPPPTPAAPARSPRAAVPLADDLPNALVIARSIFQQTPRLREIEASSELMVLTRSRGAWRARSYTDPESRVFHHAVAWTPPGAAPALVTLGGFGAAVKLWRWNADGLAPVETLWQADFGGKVSRMRDAEVGDLYGDGQTELAIASHDQGVVAVLRTRPGATPEIVELDRQPDTIVHEIELGDLDRDGVLEVYATRSEPNRVPGKPQRGDVACYVPDRHEGRTLVADLGGRHAKEILVDDVDGDGTDELYASVEAAAGGQLEVRRYDAGTAPTAQIVIAALPDTMARFLAAGDLDGDGRKEMVVATRTAGLWLLRPGDDPKGAWRQELIDARSKGFEHAVLLADLDGDGLAELYVASDDDVEIRRYAWDGERLARETIDARRNGPPVFTWHLAAVPVALVSPDAMER